MNLVSIICPIYNEEKFILALIDSVRNQDYSGSWELLLVDGGSTDSTRSIIQKAISEDPRIQLLHNPHQTAPHALNIGIAAARGQFIVDYLRAHDEYGMVVISIGFFAGSIIPQIAPLGIRTVILLHNFEPEYKLDSHSPLTLYGRTNKLIRYWEKKGYLLSDINLFLTPQDKQKFESEYGIRADNYVTGVFEPTDDIQALITTSPSQSAVITCALGDKQNIAPLVRFSHTYLPIFQEELPDWKVRMMGRNPGVEIMAIAGEPGVEVIPNPEDIRSLAAESAIYLCPMDAGGGLKLRIMDGLRAGQSVLAHVRAARGYDDFTGQPFFQTYSDEESFRQGLRTICQYIHSADYTRETVQKRYYRYFGLESGIKRLGAILCK